MVIAAEPHTQRKYRLKIKMKFLFLHAVIYGLSTSCAFHPPFSYISHFTKESQITPAAKENKINYFETKKSHWYEISSFVMLSSSPIETVKSIILNLARESIKAATQLYFD